MRLRVLLDSIVSSAQSVFVPGRSTIDNIMLAYESNHALNRGQGSGGGSVALKVNMSKAYDWVEWGFLEAILAKLGFSDRWVGLMRECISTVCYNVLVNGREWGPIILTRGLRQGDPLYPCLFILVAES